MTTFQMDGFQALGKTFLGCKTSKNLGENLHLKETEKLFTVVSFLKEFSKKMEVRGL